MDIHKPKVAHNLREFAVEIGTIICGILIALSLEQLVEWNHGRRELAEAREAITHELAYDAASLQMMAAQDACMDARLDVLTSWADGKIQLDSTHLASIDNRPLLRNIRFTAWDIAKTGAVAAHMSVKDRLAYADAYEPLSNQKQVIDTERLAWVEFGRFAGKTKLDADEARRLKEDVGLARANASGRRLNTAFLPAVIGKLGIAPQAWSFPTGRTARDLCGAPK